MNRRTTIAVRHLLAGVILMMLGMTAQAQTAGQKLAEAERKFFEATQAQEAAYRKALGETITGHATRCEVFLLDFMSSDKAGQALLDDPEDENFFPIRPYKTARKILKRRELKADEFKALMPALVQTVGVEENSGGAFCHLPIHGLRVYDQGILIMETSICYECANFFIQYPNRNADWVALTSRDFEDQMKKLMPIPESEIQRFKDFKSGKKAKAQGKVKPKDEK